MMVYRQAMDGESRVTPEILVVGAGAIGRVIGAGLAAAGEQVVLVDVNRELVDEINRNGVRIARGDDEERVGVEAISEVDGRGPASLVLFCVKAFATEAAAASVTAAVDDTTVVASLQNGWGNGDVLAARFGAARVVVGVTYNSATAGNRSEATHSQGATLVGPFEGEDLGNADSVAEQLRRGGFETEAVANVREEIWKKLILNAATLPTAALTGLAAGPLGAHPQMGPLVDDVTREAVAVANALGYPIEADERIALIHAALERVGDGKGSMLQDLEANRRTEIETITGAVLRAARAEEIAVPLHEALYALVRGVESARGLS